MSNSATIPLSARSQSWLDRTAIVLAVLCGIHCLATPVLLVTLPLLANTLWVSEEFHLGMLLIVLPTSLLAAFAGCRRHRDRWVISFIAAGLTVLSAVTVLELRGHAAGGAHGDHPADADAAVADTTHDAAADCADCCTVATTAGPSSLWTSEALMNSLGGLLLVMGHSRNFWLCRRHRCDHRCEN